MALHFSGNIDTNLPLKHSDQKRKNIYRNNGSYRLGLGLQENAKLHMDLINYNKKLFSIFPKHVCQKHKSFFKTLRAVSIVFTLLYRNCLLRIPMKQMFLSFFIHFFLYFPSFQEGSVKRLHWNYSSLKR